MTKVKLQEYKAFVFVSVLSPADAPRSQFPDLKNVSH